MPWTLVRHPCGFIAVLVAACSSSAADSPTASVRAEDPLRSARLGAAVTAADSGCPRAREARPTIASGAWHVCATSGDGVLKCWGGNLYGALGDGTTVDSTAPRTVGRLRDLGVVDVAAGYTHTCAITRDGDVSCWGEGRDGEIGDGANLDRYVPARVLGMHDAVAVGAGTWRSCAVRADGTVWCWGNGVLGGLGDGRNVSSNVPVQVTGVDDAIAIATGADHSCVVRAAGGVSCWGRNEAGQLGDGTTNDSDVPVGVAGLSNVIGIGCGYAHTCALTRDGNASCWGANWYGMLGDGTSTSRASAAPVKGLIGARAIAVSNLTSCALLSDGTERCWGSNALGQLGDGDTVDATTPATPSFAIGDAVVPLGAVVALSAADTSCAITLGRVTLCWGANDRGQVGDGTRLERNRPSVVRLSAEPLARSER